MKYKVRILVSARQDIQESIQWYNEQWYNEQKKGLGKLFYMGVKARIAYLQENPLHYPVTYRDLRQAPVHRFPYQVHYQVDEDKNDVIILAITHTSRNPQVWKDRG
jgi:plasmid stabilization system protein ParE